MIITFFYKWLVNLIKIKYDLNLAPGCDLVEDTALCSVKSLYRLCPIMVPTVLMY